MSEPLFGLYEKDRDDVPDDPVNEEFTKVKADKIIRGWDNVSDFLDETKQVEEHNRETAKVIQYLWKEAEIESAPVHKICSVCNAQVQTRSEERVQQLRSMHKISTGH